MSTHPVNTTGTDDIISYVWNNIEWDFIPDPILFKILIQLPVRDILNVSECCRRWNDLIKDDYLWKKVFQRDFKVDRTIALKPGTILICLGINNKIYSKHFIDSHNIA